MEHKGRPSLLRNPNFQDSLFVGICSVILLCYSLYHHHFDRNTSEWKTSPFLFPVLISVFGLLLVVSLVSDAIRETRNSLEAGAASETGAPEKKNLTGVLVLVAASFAYYFLMQKIHFIAATVLYLLALFLYLGEQTWWKLLLLSVITTGAIYVLFGMCLNVRLP